MDIKMKATTTDGVELLLHFDFKIHNLIVEQVSEDVTYFGFGKDGSSGSYYVWTDSIEEID